MPSNPAFEALLDPAITYTRGDVLSRPSAIPPRSGLYAWYFDAPVPGVPLDGCHATAHGTLLYVGISPSPPPRNGKRPSRQNLYTRIRYHFTGNAAGSTLRLTLGCHLRDTLGIELRRVGSGDRLTFSPPGEKKLSEWMSHHARVATLEHPAPWELEPPLIAAVNVPLNIDHNSSNPHYLANRMLRARNRTDARARPIWAP
jgi:hypothetical protein